MAPLVHIVFRQSRTVRDVIVMSCMLDLAQEDVSTALDLALARVEGLLRAAALRIKTGLTGQQHSAAPNQLSSTPRTGSTRLQRWLTHRITWPGVVVDGLVHVSCERVQMLMPMLALVAWFALPMSAVACACAGLVTIEMHMAAP